MISLFIAASTLAADPQPFVVNEPILNDGWVIEPKSIFLPAIPLPVTYPDDAVRANQGAVVWVRAHIVEGGTVDSVEVVYSSDVGYGFNESASAAVRLATFDTTANLGWSYIPFWYFLDSTDIRRYNTPTAAYLDTTEAHHQPQLDGLSTPRWNIPVMRHEERPVYPSGALEVGVKRTVSIKALVDCKGYVRDVAIDSSCGHESLDSAAVKAAYKCLYFPAVIGARPVAVWVRYPITFSVEDSMLAGDPLPTVAHRACLAKGWKINLDELLIPYPPIQPEYPAKAIAAKQGATVWIRAIFDRHGRMQEANVAYSTDSLMGFNEACLEAVRLASLLRRSHGSSAFIPFYFSFDSTSQIQGRMPYDPPDSIDVAPVMIFQKEPKYPREARRAELEGLVYVKALVDKDGSVREAQVARSSGVHALDVAAFKAAYDNRFTPAMQNGQPTSVWVLYRVQFSLYE